METKPKTELLEKVLSKLNFENSFSEIEKRNILNNEGGARAWHIKELMLQMESEARESQDWRWASLSPKMRDKKTEKMIRASTLAEVKTLLESRLISVRTIINNNDEDRYPNVGVDARARLAELTALLEKLSSLQKPSEKVSSKADDKKV